MLCVGDRVLLMEMYGYGLGADDIGIVGALGATREDEDRLWVRFSPKGGMFEATRYHVFQLPYPKEAQT